jgi:hypothetical protein
MDMICKKLGVSTSIPQDLPYVEPPTPEIPAFQSGFAQSASLANLNEHDDLTPAPVASPVNYQSEEEPRTSREDDEDSDPEDATDRPLITS